MKGCHPLGILLAAVLATTGPVVAAAFAPGAGSAGPVGSVVPHRPDRDLARRLKELEHRSDVLHKEYRGELVTLREAERAARRAAAQVERVDRDLEAARARVRRLAVGSYMTGGLGSVPIIVADDPGAALRDAAVVEHLSVSNGRLVADLAQLSGRAAAARSTASARITAARAEIDDLESQRGRVRRLLARFAPQTPAAAGRTVTAGGLRSPLIGDAMTVRMRTVLLAVDARFGPFPSIGCHRPGDPLDHGSGHACDFMASTGGAVPSATAQAHGDRVAQYVIDNAATLGVKYVIWRQRIWDARNGGGWRPMSDRGGVTANHHDHVHVSVL